MIRETNPADRPAIEACLATLQDYERSLLPELREGRGMAAGYLDYLLETGRDRQGKMFVWEEEGAGIVGFVSVWIRRDMDALESTVNEYGYVTDLVVTETHRRRGIGKALLEAAERHTAACGVQHIRINVLATNAAAIEAYHRVGFADFLISLRKRVPGARTT
jgi:ribosomal protein S18 acetylase RimI-like enzyme